MHIDAPHGTAWPKNLERLPQGLTPNQKEQEDVSIAFAISDDGSVVVGSSG
jgi:uncharacterized membrane protein